MDIHEKIRALRSRMNTLQPISSLPFDILTRIFKELQSLPFYEYTMDNRIWYWLCIIHVSRDWRQVALNYPGLWNSIQAGFQVPEQTEFFLKHSGKADLYVYYITPLDDDGKRTEGCMRCLELTLEHLSRIRFLSITTMDIGSNANIRKLLSLPAPKLNHFKLDWLPGHYKALNSRESEALSLSWLFGNTAQELQNITLNYYFVPWNSQFLRNLKNLTLSSFKRSISTSQLLAIIRASPEMERLTLADVVIEEQQVIIHEEELTLSHLRELSFKRLKYRPCHAILSLLKFSKGLVWDIYCIDYPIGNVNDSSGGEIFHIMNCYNEPCNKFCLYITSESVRVYSGTKDRSDSELSIGYSWRSDVPSNAAVFKSLSLAISGKSWSYATSININLNDVYFTNFCHNADLDCWICLLNVLPHVKTIRLQVILTENFPESVIMFLCALMLPVSQESEDERTYLCPKLSKLSIGVIASTVMDLIRDCFAEFLVKFLEVRCENDMRLQRLDFRYGFPFTPQQISKIKSCGFVDEVTGYTFQKNANSTRHAKRFCHEFDLEVEDPSQR